MYFLYDVGCSDVLAGQIQSWMHAYLAPLHAANRFLAK